MRFREPRLGSGLVQERRTGRGLKRVLGRLLGRWRDGYTFAVLTWNVRAECLPVRVSTLVRPAAVNGFQSSVIARWR